MTSSLYDIEVKTIEGQSQSLSEYQGKVLLIVNLASYCGYTRQYKELEALNQTYRDQGLRILGFPCNDYGAQEPGTNAEIKAFCDSRYGVTFDLFDKVKITRDPHPLYQYLRQNASPSGDISWNFEKFLISKEGKITGRFKSSVTPDAPELVKAIETELKRCS